MNFLRTYTVQRYCSYNSINGLIRRCSHTSDKQKSNVPPRTIKSTLYPDYQIIYRLPYITHASILSKLKRNSVIFVGATIPVIGILAMQDFILVKDAVAGVAGSLIIFATMHIISSLCNNLIGVIYYKEDDKKVIISYLNYWGKRVDLFTDVNDIILRKPTSKFTHLHRKLYVKSHEKNLKMFTKFLDIVNDEKSNIHGIFHDVK